MLPISAIRLKAEDYNPDGKCVIISLMTKYSKVERKYSVPVECLYDFIVDLQRLKAFANEAPTNSVPATDSHPRMMSGRLR